MDKYTADFYRIMSGSTIHYEIEPQAPYKPIHIPTYEDTPENIERCNQCVFTDCIYANVDRCILINGIDFERAKLSRKPKPKPEKQESVLMPIAHKERMLAGK